MKKMIKIMLLITLILFTTTMVFAENEEETYTWWSKAYSFFNGNYTEANVEALSNIQEMIKFIGNMIFVIATVILGIKYIWGSVESKASVKESLITLIVAAMFFYTYSMIDNLFTGDKGILKFSESYKTTAITIYSTILYICNFFAIGGIVYVGIKYMMAGAEGRAELKTKSLPMVLGIIMVYATITFLNFALEILF